MSFLCCFVCACWFFFCFVLNMPVLPRICVLCQSLSWSFHLDLFSDLFLHLNPFLSFFFNIDICLRATTETKSIEVKNLIWDIPIPYYTTSKWLITGRLIIIFFFNVMWHWMTLGGDWSINSLFMHNNIDGVDQDLHGLTLFALEFLRKLFSH